MSKQLPFVQWVGPLLLALAGCTALQPSADQGTTVSPDVSAAAPVQRTGRYTGVVAAPTDAERDPLVQIVTLRFPASVRTVRAAIEHALRGTGYRFADFDAESVPDLPLPDVHREMGPMRLTDAIAALAGEPWQLRVNPVTRVASLDLRPEFRRYLPAPAAQAVAVAVAAAHATPAPAAVPVPAAPVGPAVVQASAAAAPAAASAATAPWRPAQESLAGSDGVRQDALAAAQRTRNPWLSPTKPTFAARSDESGMVMPVAAEQPVPFDAPPPGTPTGNGFDIVVGSAPAARDDVFDIVPGNGEPPRQQAGKGQRDRATPPAVATATPVPAPAAIQPLVRLGPGTLSVLLDGWMRAAGWTLVWKSGADYRVDVPFSLDAGSPADPVKLMAALSGLYGVPHCAYPSNRTIVVLQPGTDLGQECR